MKHEQQMELDEMKAVIHLLQRRLDVIALEGGNVDQVQPLLDRLSRALDALNAKTAGTVAVSAVVEALTPIVAKAEADAGITA